MARALKSVPTFANEAEERRFWETHDSNACLDWTKAQSGRPPNLKPTQTAISSRPPMPLLERIKMWLAEKVREG
jgi:CopG antitoxin of type II toxin-antitoxin system